MLKRALELEKEISRVQNSTRTSCRFFVPIHNWFRMHSRLYYIWSLKPYAQVVHWTILLLYFCMLPVLVHNIYNPRQVEKAKASGYQVARWEWETPKPTGVTLTSITGIPGTNRTVAVGAGGTILFNDGSAWSNEFNGGIGGNLYGVAATDAAHIWVVGADNNSNGQIYSYTGISGSWTSQLTTPVSYLVGITATDQNHVWAAGHNGEILFYDGNSWTVQIDTDATLNSIDSVLSNGKSYVWAVGNNGKIFYFDGDQWNDQTTEYTTDNYVSVSVVNPYEVYANSQVTHQYGSSTTRILKFDGLSWSAPDNLNTDLNSDYSGIKAYDSSHIWIYRNVDPNGWSIFDGTRWTTPNSPFYGKGISSVYAKSINDIWAVGDGGSISHYDGSVWTLNSVSQGPSPYLLDIKTKDLGGGQYSIVSGGMLPGGNLMFHYDGLAWTTSYFGEVGVHLWDLKISYNNLNDIWIAGGNDFYQYNGSVWTSIDKPYLMSGIYGISTYGENKIVVAGMNSANKGIIDQQFWDAECGCYAWDPVYISPTVQTFTDVTAIDESHMWAVSNKGTIVYNNGASWSSVYSNTDIIFNAVTAIYDAETGLYYAWAVGKNGKVVYFDGNSWVLQTVPVPSAFVPLSLSSVTAQNKNSVWVAAKDSNSGLGYSFLFHFNGSDWTKVDIMSSATAVASTSDQLWAAGSAGIMTYRVLPNAIADELVLTVNSESFVDDVGIVGTAGTVYAGENNVSAKIYAVNNSNTVVDQNNASWVGFSTNSSGTINPANLQLTQGDTCVQYPAPEAGPVIPCGEGTTNFSFHRAGNWTISVSDAGKILQSDTSSVITVLPGTPHHPRFSSSSISSNAGVASKVTLGLADLYDNATSPDTGDKTVHLSSSSNPASTTARFSTSADGPWTESLNLTIPKGDPTIESETANKTADFWYLDFTPTSSTITASDSANPAVLQSSTLPVTITAGLVNQSASNISLSSSSMKAGETTVATVTVSTGTSNPAISLYSSRGSTDTITQGSNSGGVAVFNIFSTKTGLSVLSAKDDTDNTWLQNTNSLTINPASISNINLDPKLSTATAGDKFSITATVFDRYGNKAGADSTLFLSASDKKIENLPDSYTLKNNDSYTFSDIILKTAGSQTITARLKDDLSVTATATIAVSSASLSVSSSYISANNDKPIFGKGNIYLEAHTVDAYLNPVSGIEIALYFDNQYFKNATSATTKSSFLIKKILAASSNTDKYTTDASGKFVFELEPLKTGKTTVYAKDTQTGEVIGAPIEIEILPDTLLSNISSLINSLQNSTTAKAIANIAQNVVATAATLGLIPIIAGLISSAPAAAHAAAYAFSLGMEAIGIRRRRRTWGRVYDSVSGKGIDMATVRLFDKDSMKLLSTHVTDIKGRYSFSPQPGAYVISVIKENYVFPTSIFAKYGIKGMDKAAARINKHYVGQPINISTDKNLIILDIPIDPYNTKPTFFVKAKILIDDIFEWMTTGLSHILVPSLCVGSMVSIFAAIVLPSQRNIIISSIYIVVSLIYIISSIIKGRHFGIVFDSKTKKPIAEAVVSVFEKEYDTLKETRITDKFGRFSISVPHGNYHLKVEKEHYTFPSKKIKKRFLRGKGHKNLYLGETIEARHEEFINISVPMDPTGKDLKKELKGLF